MTHESRRMMQSTKDTTAITLLIAKASSPEYED